jgi:signal transduction histidine kinase
MNNDLFSKFTSDNAMNNNQTTDNELNDVASKTKIALRQDTSEESDIRTPSLEERRFCLVLTMQRILLWIQKNTFILAISFFIFGILVASSIAVSSFLTTAQEKDARDEALDLAVETGRWFSDQLDLAILPLFSLAQFAVEIPILHQLPHKIGTAFDYNDDDEKQNKSSLPFLPPFEVGDSYTHRNVTGVCDDPALIKRFNGIAAMIKKNAKMEGILVNLQLAPEAVVCLLYPLVNTEDFTNNITLNNTGARGLDLLVDPISSFIAKASLAQDSISIAGPLVLRQCRDISCDPAVQQAFIARLPIAATDNTIHIDGRSFQKWGFATALINWNALVTRSSIYSNFASRGMEFQLTRTDRKFNDQTELYDISVVVLAETPTFSKFAQNQKKVTTALQTTNNEWEITVIYDVGHSERTKALLFSLSFILSFFIAALILIILEQRQSQARIKGKVLAQSAAVETERNMTAYFAHELRNPLSAIDSALSAMPDELPESTKELISGMQMCSNFMASIMNNLLDVRKMEEGKMNLISNPTSLSDLILCTHKMLKVSAKDGVTFSTMIATEGKDWVCADAHRLQQVLSNVVTNALKHTKQGSVVLTVGWVEGIVKFECIDTGPGIPKDQQELMFERFVQREGAPGSGLGLAIAKNIVNLMDGSIHFDSDPDVRPGTNCIIQLPLPDCDPPDHKPTKYVKIAPIDHVLSILIVDDLSMNRSMLKRRIVKGIAPRAEVTEASTGERALELCDFQKFDVIVMDQYMEEAGGVLLGTDVVRILRSRYVDSIIIGSSGNDIDSEFQDAGVDWTWRKPIPSNDAIITRLRAALLAKGRI